ncbi:hypothetical protein NDU88_004938 [Pleurodeles waltl]|uniref:Uncharacterized protein n=1 Tax=Pleurodeles waltl TaxID=8319 RepID=A0AAV7N2W4_PLEWA|nr:hypothetical protein NDU88_004938 [Pleurodeles waltl]
MAGLFRIYEENFEVIPRLKAKQDGPLAEKQEMPHHEVEMLEPSLQDHSKSDLTKRPFFRSKITITKKSPEPENSGP